MSKLKLSYVTDGGKIDILFWKYLNVSTYSLKDVYWDIHKSITRNSPDLQNNRIGKSLLYHYTTEYVNENE